jgi:hypothetical protein
MIMKPQLLDIGTRDGILGGTFLSVFGALHAAGIVQAVVMGIIGTAVSFLTSTGLRWVMKRISRWVN